MATQTDLKPEKISSEITGFLRNVFPSLWTGGFGFVAVGIWFEWFGQPTPEGQKLAIVALWAVISVLLPLWTRSLREVWVTDRELIVSSEGTQVRIPLTSVREIRESRGQKVKTIRILLKEETRIGSKIKFIPAHQLQAPFTDHPVVKDLRLRAAHIAVPGMGQQNRLP